VQGAWLDLGGGWAVQFLSSRVLECMPSRWAYLMRLGLATLLANLNYDTGSIPGSLAKRGGAVPVAVWMHCGAQLVRSSISCFRVSAVSHLFGRGVH
jgi:hypothetical protein